MRVDVNWKKYRPKKKWTEVIDLRTCEDMA